jgi:phosphatidylinositol alpha-1,6-mannosyltransferase
VAPRKVLLVTNDLGPRAGGIETFILGLLDHLDGSQIVIYTAAQPESEEFDAALAARSGVVVIRDRRSILIPTPAINRRVREVALQYQSEIVWFGAAMPLAWMSGLLKRAGIKRIVALTHGHEVWWAKLPPFRQIFGRSTRFIDALTYLGEFTRQAMAPVVKNSCRMVQIAPGISISHFTPGAKSPELIAKYGLEGKQVLVSVGRLVHRKGQDKLLEALPLILAQHPDLVLLLVGIGPRQKKLEQIIKANELQEYVRFVGRVNYEKLPEYFRLADLFVMPSRSRLAGLEVEGLGIVYLEASSCGVPVLAGQSGGAPDAVISGKTGEVVDGTSIEKIAESINSLLDHPTRLREMGSSGRQWTQERWSWEIWGERFRAVLFGD